MTEAKTYAPGAIASFFAKSSINSTAALKEQSQLRALFDSSNETKSRKRQQAVSFPELPKISKKLKEADGSVEGKQNADSKVMTLLSPFDLAHLLLLLATDFAVQT